jgi:circadian clock protein KaiB
MRSACSSGWTSSGSPNVGASRSLPKNRSDGRIGGDATSFEGAEQVVLRLYISGPTPRSASAIVNVRKLCEAHLAGRYDLEVIDLSQAPALASARQIIAVPTLVRESPLPERRFVGDMSNNSRLLVGLDVNDV